VRRVVPLAGRALSVDRLLVEDRGGRSRSLVLRRWTRPGWRETDPDENPGREAAILEALAEGDPALPVPRVVAVDPHGAGAGVPAILLTWLPGTVRERHAPLSPAAVASLGGMLARIHGVDGRLRAVTFPFYPFWDGDPSDIPAATRRRDLWERAMDIAARPPAPGPDTFLHRDFHPGNIVWRDDAITGVLDWTGACWGPPEADLGHLRVNLAADHGISEADAARRAWLAAGGEPVDPVHWDVRMLLDWLPDLDDAYARGPGLDRLERYLADLLQQT
jgi:aminoglycoside phosphotransferase (APT) family kinase protein